MVSRLVKWLTVVKYRWDLAVSFLVFVNFSLLAVTASDKVQAALRWMGYDIDLVSISTYMVIFSFLGVLLAGYILDKYARYAHHMTATANERNMEIQEILSNTREIKEKLEAMGHGSNNKE